MTSKQAFKRPRISNNGGDHHDESSSVVIVGGERRESSRRQHYKTRLCSNFKQGRCRYGQACLYAHSLDELRYTPGGSSNHYNRVCNNFSNGVRCVYGQRCRFLHVRMPRSSTITRDGDDDDYDEEVARSDVGLKGDDNGGRQFGNAVPRKLCSYKTMATKYSKTCTTKEMQVWDGKFDRKFWNELVRMSRIHADWIEEIPLVHGQLQ